MSDVERTVIYFGHCGEANTEKVLTAARRRCEETGIGTVVVASETGRSALRALEVFEGSPTRLVVVTHYPATTWGPKGRIPIGISRPEYSDTLMRLREGGVKVVQGTRPLAPPTSRSAGTTPPPRQSWTGPWSYSGLGQR